MSLVLPFPEKTRGEPRAALPAPEAMGFWPEVASYPYPPQVIDPNHDNAAGPVLRQVFLVLAGTAAMVAAVVIWIPAPT